LLRSNICGVRAKKVILLRTKPKQFGIPDSALVMIRDQKNDLVKADHQPSHTLLDDVFVVDSVLVWVGHWIFFRLSVHHALPTRSRPSQPMAGLILDRAET